MKNVTISLLAGLLCAAVAQPAFAYHEVGAGTDTCAAWTADRQIPTSAAALQDEQWVLGFLTGIGFAGSAKEDPLNGTGAQAVWGWVDTWCQQHPDEKLVTGARAFFKYHPN